MTLIAPFAGLRPAPEKASEILAPPYDVLSSEEARVLAQHEPNRFLHVSKPEIDCPDNINPYDPAVYAQGLKNFQRMQDQGLLVRDRQVCYYAYRITMGTHCQTGLVAGVSVAAYDRQDVRTHEMTRPEKEDDRMQQIHTLNAQTGPVFLIYKDLETVDDILYKTTQTPTQTDVTLNDGIRHELWVIDEPFIIQALTKAFDCLGVVYVADGHHRCAAASRVAALRRAGHYTSTAHEYFLSVIFPAHQIKILDYNRVIRNLNGFSQQQFLDRIQNRFSLTKVAHRYRPVASGELGMYLDGQWYVLRIDPKLIPKDPVQKLDVSLLTQHVIEPLLGISDLRTDPGIDFVGGIRGLKELEKRVDSGEMALAFSLFPMGIADLIKVADTGQTLPPKSTWFEPKLADGIVCRLLD